MFGPVIFKIQADVCAPHFNFLGLYLDKGFKSQRSGRKGAALGGVFFSQWLRLVFHVRLAFEEEPRMKQKIHVLPVMMSKLTIVSGLLIKLK